MDSSGSPSHAPCGGACAPACASLDGAPAPLPSYRQPPAGFLPPDEAALLYLSHAAASPQAASEAAVEVPALPGRDLPDESVLARWYEPAHPGSLPSAEATELYLSHVSAAAAEQEELSEELLATVTAEGSRHAPPSALTGYALSAASLGWGAYASFVLLQLLAVVAGRTGGFDEELDRVTGHALLLAVGLLVLVFLLGMGWLTRVLKTLEDRGASLDYDRSSLWSGLLPPYRHNATSMDFAESFAETMSQVWRASHPGLRYPIGSSWRVVGGGLSEFGTAVLVVSLLSLLSGVASVEYGPQYLLGSVVGAALLSRSAWRAARFVRAVDCRLAAQELGQEASASQGA